MSTNYTSRDVYEYISQQANDPILERRRCAVSGAEFPIYTSDAAFYEKISPVFNGIKYAIPFPTLCPEERQRRRLLFRNERKLYKRICDATGESIISIYSPDKPYKVYNQKFRWGDGWSALDYGREFDFTRTFTEQFGELMKVVPRASLYNLKGENSDYCNYSTWCKNCYMCFSTTAADCLYCDEVKNGASVDAVDCVDCYMCIGLQNSYACVSTHFSQKCFSCISCEGLYECYNCNDCNKCEFCIGCSNLRNQKYMINNVQVTPEEYQIAKETIVLQYTPARWYNRRFNMNTENSCGNGLRRSKDCLFCFDVFKTDTARYAYQAGGKESSDFGDVDYVTNAQLSYELVSAGGYHNMFSAGVVMGCRDVWYSESCSGCESVFGCVGLVNQKYCVFNVQYSQEDYYELVGRIVTHMQTTGDWGEFLHHTLAPFAYNETVSGDDYLMEREQALGRGYQRQDAMYDPVIPEGVPVLHPGAYDDTGWNAVRDADDVLKSLIICSISGRPFRVVKQEVDFYRTHALPLPTRHPDVRYQEREKQRPGRTIYLRTCDETHEKILSVYPQGVEKNVYGLEAYKKKIRG